MEYLEGIEENADPSLLDKKRREQQWKLRAAEIGYIVDGLGKPIDSGIFDTVVALNLFNIRTTQSCEGHLDHGIASPWVQIEAPETDEIVSLRNRVNELSELIEKLENEGKQDEELTPHYKEIRRLYEQIKRPQLGEIQKAILLLKEFYESRQISYEKMLTIHGNRLESQGAQLQDIISPENRGQKLLEYQQEMKSFTAFLRNKFIRS